MSARKGSIGGSGGFRGEGIKRTSPTPDAEYLAAVAILNEETMSDACALLLSENDSGDDYHKLLNIFTKCEAASKVVEKKAPSVLPTLPPQAPQRAPQIAPPRSQPISLKPKSKHVAPRRMSISARPPAKQPGHGKRSFPHPVSRTLNRETSDSSFTSTASGGSARSSKRARLSPTGEDTGGVAAKPPTAAMSFLAALNKQDKKDEGSDDGNYEPNERHAPKKKGSPAKSKALPNPVPGSRKQPSRGLRK